MNGQTNAKKREKIEALLHAANLTDRLVRALSEGEHAEPDLACVVEVVLKHLQKRIADLGGAP